MALRGGVTDCTGSMREGLQRDALIAPGTRPGTREAWLPPLAPASWSRGHAVGVEEAGERVVDGRDIVATGTITGAQGTQLPPQTTARRGEPAGEGREARGEEQGTEETRGGEERVLIQSGASSQAGAACAREGERHAEGGAEAKRDTQLTTLSCL